MPSKSVDSHMCQITFQSLFSRQHQNSKLISHKQIREAAEPIRFLHQIYVIKPQIDCTLHNNTPISTKLP